MIIYRVLVSGWFIILGCINFQATLWLQERQKKYCSPFVPGYFIGVIVVEAFLTLLWHSGLTLSPGINGLRSMASTVTLQGAPEVILSPTAINKIMLKGSWKYLINIDGIFVTVQPKMAWRAFKVRWRIEVGQCCDRLNIFWLTWSPVPRATLRWELATFWLHVQEIDKERSCQLGKNELCRCSTGSEWFLLPRQALDTTSSHQDCDVLFFFF